MRIFKTFVAENKKLWLLLFATVAISFFFYRESFFSYFFQDDWYSLSISSPKNLSDVIAFFFPKTELIYYRPLGMQVPFFIFKTLFGLNPLPFRIATLMIHAINVVLVAKILQKITQQKTISLLAAFLYGVSATQFIIFNWSATIAFVLAPFFYFLSFWIYLQKKYLGSLLIFLMGLFVNELLITLPLQLILYEFCIGKEKKIKRLSIYLLLSGLYVLFRLTIAKFATTGGYQFVTSITEPFITLRNYLLWSFNTPENVGTQFLNFFRLNPVFVSEFWKFLVFPFLTIIIFFVSIGTSVFFHIQKKSFKNPLKLQMLLGVCWFMVSLAPVLFFAHHAYTYYLPIPLFGLLLIWTSVQQAKKRNVLSIFLLLVWTVASFTTINFNNMTHWAPQRSERSQVITQTITEKYPTVPNHTTFIITKPEGSEENKHALSDQHALQVLYRDKSIKTFFGSMQEYTALYGPSEASTLLLVP